MKNLRFLELLLLSEVEKAAKAIPLDNEVTVLLGQNDTGKSCLVKSIYKAFGASPAVSHPSWNGAKVLCAVRFSVDSSEYTILRHDTVFGVFDQSGVLIESFDSITNGLGPFLAELLDFELLLSNRQKIDIIPPPQYLFLPFYVDQDKGWSDSWSSFDRLKQLPRFRQPLAEYHTGIRNNEFYRVRAQLESKKNELSVASSELTSLQASLERVSEHLQSPILPVDLDDFEQEINRLTTLVQNLKIKEEKRLSALLQLENRRAIAQEQLHIATLAYKEIQSDYDYATNTLQDAVECPTCGAEYSNSFSERFGLADDAARCQEVLVALTAQVKQLSREIDAARPVHEEAKKKYDEVKALLKEKKDSVVFEDVVKSKGRAELERVFMESIEPAQKLVNELQAEVDILEARKKSLADKNQKQRVEGFYREHMRRYLHALDVKTLDEESYKFVHSTISEIGSDLPRALLAYYFSILHTVREFGSAAFCPIIIDSPNQQAQDKENLPKMFDFIFNNRPQGSQLLLATEDLYGVQPEGETIVLDFKHRLLDKDNYSAVRARFEPMLDALHS